ncbi:putative ribonuclease H protein [Tanacetum coccineum]|uniref:Ribonuclease H protein n=1 Tax=Tanacetum coccineum TaxID=301880 RepID=A0ABQ5BH98_9ASTR
MGFGEKWCSWIDACLKSSSISVLVNGSPTIEFGLERGVRQGDPLSPFLFILAAEGLNLMIKEAVEKCIFKGIKVGSERVVVSHLQYADDTIFFGEWDKENAKNLMCILKCFERVSGLKVNLNKSRLYGVGVNSDEVSNMASWMDSWRWNLTQDEDELDKRGIDLDSLLCPCCDDSVESCDHSLVTCNVAKSVWDKNFEWWKIGPVNVFSANDLFRFSGNVAVHSYSRALWQLVDGVVHGIDRLLVPRAVVEEFNKRRSLREISAVLPEGAPVVDPRTNRLKKNSVSPVPAGAPPVLTDYTSLSSGAVLANALPRCPAGYDGVLFPMEEKAEKNATEVDTRPQVKVVAKQNRGVFVTFDP